MDFLFPAVVKVRVVKSPSCLDWFAIVQRLSTLAAVLATLNLSFPSFDHPETRDSGLLFLLGSSGH